MTKDITREWENVYITFVCGVCPYIFICFCFLVCKVRRYCGTMIGVPRYDIISYRRRYISYHRRYDIISYHIVSYHAMAYHIIPKVPWYQYSTISHHRSIIVITFKIKLYAYLEVRYLGTRCLIPVGSLPKVVYSLRWWYTVV